MVGMYLQLQMLKHLMLVHIHVQQQIHSDKHHVLEN
jgi:hypothetical protein